MGRSGRSANEQVVMDSSSARCGTVSAACLVPVVMAASASPSPSPALPTPTPTPTAADSVAIHSLPRVSALVCVGFESGWIRIFYVGETPTPPGLLGQQHPPSPSPSPSPSPLLLLAKKLHAAPILQIKHRIIHSSNSTADSDEITVLFADKTVVAMDGQSLLNALKTALANPSQPPCNATDSSSLTFKKWQIQTQDRLHDIECLGSGFSCFLSASGALSTTISNKIYPVRYIGVGTHPCISVYASLEHGKPLTSSSSHASSKSATNSVATALSSFAKSIWGSSSTITNNNNNAAAAPAATTGDSVSDSSTSLDSAPLFNPAAETRESMEPATLIPATITISDSGRAISTISMCPPSLKTGKSPLAALVDRLGRVILMDVEEGEVVRMWKGMRDAQVGWIQQQQQQQQNHHEAQQQYVYNNYEVLRVEERHQQNHHHPTSSCSTAHLEVSLLLVIYSPRGAVEVFRMRNGDRVLAIQTEPQLQLLQRHGRGLLGASSINLLSSQSALTDRSTSSIISNDSQRTKVPMLDGLADDDICVILPSGAPYLLASCFLMKTPHQLIPIKPPPPPPLSQSSSSNRTSSNSSPTTMLSSPGAGSSQPPDGLVGSPFNVTSFEQTLACGDIEGMARSLVNARHIAEKTLAFAVMTEQMPPEYVVSVIDQLLTLPQTAITSTTTSPLASTNATITTGSKRLSMIPPAGGSFASPTATSVTGTAARQHLSIAAIEFIKEKIRLEYFGIRPATRLTRLQWSLWQFLSIKYIILSKDPLDTGMWDAKSAELLVGEICEGVTGFPFVDTACFYDGGASRMGAGGGVGREEVMEQDTISTNLVIKDEICSLAAFSQAFWIRQPNEQHQLPFEFLHMKRGISTSAKLAVAHTLFKSVMDRRLPISIWRSEILNGMLMADSVWLDLLLLFLNSPHMFSLFGGGAGESAELEQEGEDRKTKRRERLAQLVNILVEIFSRVLKNGKKTMSDGEMGPIESSIFEICSNSIKIWPAILISKTFASLNSENNGNPLEWEALFKRICDLHILKRSTTNTISATTAAASAGVVGATTTLTPSSFVVDPLTPRQYCQDELFSLHRLLSNFYVKRSLSHPMPALFTLITPGELLHSNSNNAIIVQDVWKYFEHLISPDLLLASICFEHGHLWNELKSIDSVKNMIEAIAQIKDVCFRNGVIVSMWTNFLSAKWYSIYETIDKGRKAPNDKLCVKLLGFDVGSAKLFLSLCGTLMKLLDWDDAHNLDRDRLIIASKSLFESAALQLRHHHGLYQPWQAVGTFYNGVVGQMIQTLSFGSAESSSSIDGSIVDTIDWLTECMVVTFEYEVKQVRPMKLVESLKKFNQLMNSDEIMAALVSVAIVAGTSAVSADVATTIIAQQGEEMLQDLGANLPEMSSSTSSIESHEESVASDVNSSSSAPPSATTTTTNTTPAPPGKSKEEIKIYQERLSFFKKLQACKYPNRAELAIKFQLDLADRIEEDENE